MKKPVAYIFVLAFLALSYSSFAGGPPPPPGGGMNPSCWPPPCIPIDGGLSFLLIAGAAYGAKKVYDLGK
jgi:hypothetical protein